MLQNTRHNPNNAGFPNGTIKGTICIDCDQVIGGAERIGDGWKMLMECLAVGRGVSLPATANGSSKLITHSIMHYINIRKQFNMKIGNMEAVREKFVDMYLNTWIIHTSVRFTNHILDTGSTPSVITAIMKQQTTERARTVLNHGMDIYAGSGICTGANNFFTPFYHSSPVGITVEGSNTLTRGLIIFGQGLNKSHPHIFPIFESIQENNLLSFQTHINRLVASAVVNYCAVLWRGCTVSSSPHARLELATLQFSVLANCVALLGGRIKSKQMISGNMADIVSNLYLAYSVLWYYKHHQEKSETSSLLRDECLFYLLNELDVKMNAVVANYPLPFVRRLLYPMTNRMRHENWDEKNRLYKLIVGDAGLHALFKDDIYYRDTVLEKMETLRKMNENTDEYNALYQDIISVGEYPLHHE